MSFIEHRAVSSEVPIIISSPHSGTEIPEEFHAVFQPRFLQKVEDTDWYIHRLYDFAPELGIHLIYAKFSRYVIDLNRSPQQEQLYNDGRLITELVPTKSFKGESLYLGKHPSDEEIQYRYEKYYKPYHEQISTQIKRLKQKFNHVLLFDAHSIKSMVQSIQDQKFPDLILGNNDLRSADSSIIQAAWKSIEAIEDLEVSHNAPFKGGYITRNFGKPNQGVHSLQLEMCQSVYMNEEDDSWDELKAKNTRAFLMTLFENLAQSLKKMNGLS